MNEWPTAPPPSSWRLEEWASEPFEDGASFGDTYAVAIAYAGSLVFERYGGRLPSLTGDGEEVSAETRLLSWSVAKSLLHAALGRLVLAKRLSIYDPPGVEAWEGDERSAITVEHLLAMRDGLDFVEVYDAEAERSDVVQMLFGGVEDMAAFAADRPLIAPPDTRYYYSSGSSVILSGMVARLVGTGDAYRRWLDDEVFRPLGMASAIPGFDSAGTWVASSYVYATARDWLRFGEAYRRDGVVNGLRILPPGWVEHGRRARSADDDGVWYGAHWWTEEDGHGTFWAEGYEGQLVLVCPAAEAVVVRFGRTEEGSTALAQWRRRLVERLVEGLGKIKG